MAPRGKTRMVPKTSKFTTAWWLASNWKNMPLAMKCRMRIRQNQVWPKLCCQGRGVAITAKMIGAHPETIMWGRLAQGIATAKRIEATISECPLTLYQILSVTQSKKAELPQHKPGSPSEYWWIPATSQLHLFFTTRSLLRTILDPASW